MADHRILSAVLARANACPPANFRAEFYEIKQHILSLYGVHVGFDYQRIVHHCWGEYYGSCGDDCVKCGGTGIYQTVIVELERWRYRRRVFHRPVRRLFGDEAKTAPITIEGKIEHRRMEKARDCAAALFVIFAPHVISLATDNRQMAAAARRCFRIVAAIGPVPREHVIQPAEETIPF